MGTRLLLLGLLATSICCLNAEQQAERSVFVSGKSECIDCADKNIKTELAYEGLQVAVKCKSSKGDYEIKGTGSVDKNGDYKVQLPADLVGNDGELKQECVAQLHGATNEPCPDENGLNPSKIALKSKDGGVHTFSTAAKLPFSPATCASAFFCKWPHYKPIYKKPKYYPIYKKPKYYPIYKKPYPKYPPTYTKPGHP